MDYMFAIMVLMRVTMVGSVCTEFANSGVDSSGRIGAEADLIITSIFCAGGISSRSCWKIWIIMAFTL